jgi:hypothetical protein
MSRLSEIARGLWYGPKQRTEPTPLPSSIVPPLDKLHAAVADAEKYFADHPLPEKPSPVEAGALEIEETMAKTMKHLFRLPSGENFPDILFLPTLEKYIDPHGTEGVNVVTINKEGKIRKIGATVLNRHGEWDIDNTLDSPHMLTPDEILDYSPPLLVVLQLRLAVQYKDFLLRGYPEKAETTYQDMLRATEASLSVSESLAQVRHKLEQAAAESPK